MMTLLNNILCNQYTPPCVGWVIPQLSWKKIPIGEISSLKYLVDYGVRSRLQLPSLLANEARLKALRSLKPKPTSFLIVSNMSFSLVSFYQTFKTIFFFILLIVIFILTSSSSSSFFLFLFLFFCPYFGHFSSMPWPFLFSLFLHYHIHGQFQQTTSNPKHYCKIITTIKKSRK